MTKYTFEGKEVEAFVIDSHWDYNQEGGLEVKLLENGETPTATAAMTSMHRPKPGDYWVNDGEDSYLVSKEVFESSSTPENQTDPLPEESL